MSGSTYYLSRMQFFAVLGSLVLVLFLFWLIRRRKLLIEYSLLWLGIFTVFLLISIFGGLLDQIARFFGIFYPPASLFILLIIGVFLLLLHFSTIISELKGKINELSIRIALLEERSRESRKDPDGGTDDKGQGGQSGE